MRTIGLLRDHAADEIPASHLDLVECPPVAALTTVMADGYPQTSVVWCDFDGECVRVNTMRGFAKERNMRRDPRVTLLCYDPRQPLRYLEVRGTVDRDDRGGRRRAPRRAGLEVRGPADPLLRRRDPGPLRRDRDPRPVPDPTGPRRGRSTPTGEGRAMTTPVAPAAPTVPISHVDLLTRPICGVFTTMGPDGQPQSSLVWVDFDGACARVNTTLERRKGCNLLANARCSLLVVDPDNTGALHPGPGRRGARPRRRRRASRRPHAQVHAPSAVLRLHLSGGAAGARDAGHLPDPRAPDHPRRDPRLSPALWGQSAIRNRTIALILRVGATG